MRHDLMAIAAFGLLFYSTNAYSADVDVETIGRNLSPKTGKYISSDEVMNLATAISNKTTQASILPQLSFDGDNASVTLGDKVLTGKLIKMHKAENGQLLGVEIAPDSNFPERNGTPFIKTSTRLLVPLDRSNPPTPAEAVRNVTGTKNSSAATNVTNGPPNGSSYNWWNTPSSINCIYELVPQPTGQPAGCNPLYTTKNQTIHGHGTVGIITYGDHPSLATNLYNFEKYFGLPDLGLTQIYVSGNGPPPQFPGWDFEANLDIQAVRAMSPYANIVVFELDQRDTSVDNLARGIGIARSYLMNNYGGGILSLSLGLFDQSYLSSNLLSWEKYLTSQGASGNQAIVVNGSGDWPGSGAFWPGSSPNAISVGATETAWGTNTSFLESAWTGSEGGYSVTFPSPNFQSFLGVRYRATPDISLVGSTTAGAGGMWVYFNGQWVGAAGTSLSAPLAAGVLNISSGITTADTTATVLNNLYASRNNTAYIRDITTGYSAIFSEPQIGEIVTTPLYYATPGYDLATGIGVLRGTVRYRPPALPRNPCPNDPNRTTGTNMMACYK